MPQTAVGLVYTPGLEGVIATRGLVDILEIEPEMFWWERDGRFGIHERAWQHVRSLALPKIVHGVGFAVGGTVAPPAPYLRQLRRCVDELAAQWSSHHLAFNWFGARCAGFFLPPRQSLDGVAAAVSSIRAMTDALACPFAVETGVSYLQPREDELPDGEFVARVVEAADCGLLLDLHNIWANERNGRQRVADYLAALPLDRVVEVHVAGGFELDGYWLDAHSEVPPPALFDVLADIAPYLPNLRAVCFEILAPFVRDVGAPAIGDALERIRTICERPRGRRSITAPLPRVDVAPGPSASEWEHALGSLVTGRRTDATCNLAGDPAIPLLRRLVEQGRAGMITDALPITSRLLLRSLGVDATLALLARFWDEVAPCAFASAEADSLAAWLRTQPLVLPFLADAIAFDLASSEAESTGKPVVVSLSIDPTTLCAALAGGALPAETPARVIATVMPSMLGA